MKEEINKLLYVELPGIINRIIKLETIPDGSRYPIDELEKELKKVSITEIDSAIETYKRLTAK